MNHKTVNYPVNGVGGRFDFHIQEIVRVFDGDDWILGRVKSLGNGRVDVSLPSGAIYSLGLASRDIQPLRPDPKNFTPFTRNLAPAR